MGQEAQSCTRHCSLTAGLNLLLSWCWLSHRDAVFSYSGAGSMSVLAGLSASRWHHRRIGTDPRCSWRSMSHDHNQDDHLGHMQRAYHERCPTAEAYRLHDDDDDDDGEIYFIGQRGVKRSRRPHSHGSRSRRLKSAATGSQTVRPNLHPPPVTVTLGRPEHSDGSCLRSASRFNFSPCARRSRRTWKRRCSESRFPATQA